MSKVKQAGGPTRDGPVLVTGASSGIGLATAARLSTRGWQVFGSVRRDEDAKKLDLFGVEAVTIEMCDEASVDAGFQAVMAQTHGHLFGLFLNAGAGYPGAIEDLPRALLREQFETNVFAAVQLAKLALPRMRARGGGRIVICSSVLGFVAAPLRGAYVMSKYSAEAMADVLRLETVGSGIKVSLVQPGPIKSRFTRRSLANLSRIDTTQSVHRGAYVLMRQRLTAPPGGRYTLLPRRVAEDVVHALESARPRTRYRETLPTHLAWVLKTLLPTRLLDRVLQGRY